MVETVKGGMGGRSTDGIEPSAAPLVATGDVLSAEPSRSVDVQRTTEAYRQAMVAGRHILKKRRAVLAALAQ